MNITDLNPGETGLIIDIKFDENLTRRTNGLGIRSGEVVVLIRTDLTGFNYHVRLGTTDLMMRKDIAENIIIEPYGPQA